MDVTHAGEEDHAIRELPMSRVGELQVRQGNSWVLESLWL